VGDARQDDALEIGEHLLERLALVRRRRRKLRANLAGLDPRHHRKLLEPLEVARDPVDGLVAPPAKLIGCHVASHLVPPRSW
jgi:hypothetical protein